MHVSTPASDCDAAKTTRKMFSGNDRLQCSLALAVLTMGDYWSALIIRDLMIFGGERRFEQLREGLGISRNILTDRLNVLLGQHIIRKFPVEVGAKRMGYKLTRKGWELIPALLAIHQWCERWRPDPENSAFDFVDTRQGDLIPPVEVRAADGRVLGPDGVRVKIKTEEAKRYFRRFAGDARESRVRVEECC